MGTVVGVGGGWWWEAILAKLAVVQLAVRTVAVVVKSQVL